MDKEENNPSSQYTSAFLLVGLSLLTGGIWLVGHFLGTIKDGAAYIFIVFLPAPMIIFGLYALISALHPQELSNDELEDGQPTKKGSKPQFRQQGSNTDAETHSTIVENKSSKASANPQIGCGTVLLYLFFIFGVVVILLIVTGSVVTDINTGVTHFCRRGHCSDVFLKNSPIDFYITLALRTLFVLAVPVGIGYVIKKWINQGNNPK